MRKHAKWIAVAVVAVALLAVGLTATVFAGSGDEGAGQTATKQDEFASKVAENLGLTEEQVSDAMTQARREMQDEAVAQKLQNAVASGRITQDEADQINTWWQSRPDALGKLGAARRAQAWARQCPRALGQIFDEKVIGTIEAVGSATITVTTATGSVEVGYTATTRFIIKGATGLEVGQKAWLGCLKDAEGNLTAGLVSAGTPPATS
ncbi:MAG: hypothetical protein NTU41_10840 [Chloroflexi bacterium]|nr:hypothetical protein [Chloroflexota bacterium]